MRWDRKRTLSLNAGRPLAIRTPPTRLLQSRSDPPAARAETRCWWATGRRDAGRERSESRPRLAECEWADERSIMGRGTLCSSPRCRMCLQRALKSAEGSSSTCVCEAKTDVRSVLDAAVEGEPLLSAKVVLEQLLGVVDERIGGVDLLRRPRVSSVGQPWRASVYRAEPDCRRTLDELVEVLLADTTLVGCGTTKMGRKSVSRASTTTRRTDERRTESHGLGEKLEDAEDHGVSDQLERRRSLRVGSEVHYLQD